MARRPKRETVDLSPYPDLVVIYLGMRVNTFTGIKTLLGFGPRISKAVAAKPEGLLLHENIMYSCATRDAPVLARLRVPGSMVAIRAAPPVVAGVPAG